VDPRVWVAALGRQTFETVLGEPFCSGQKYHRAIFHSVLVRRSALV